MKNIAHFFDSINKYTGYLCAFLVVLMTVNVFIVVFLRYLFGISFIWLQETYVWMHAYIFMAGAGFTYLNDAHVRIDIIYRSSSKVYKAIVDLVGNIFLLMPFLYIIWSYSFPFVYKSFQINEVSREAGGLPMLFLLKAAILIFAFLLFIQALSKLINNFIIIYQK
tara:strand:+ start:88 stop:585 length:498 start_codon:yes stop_codon:yes gene_type:complete